MVEGRNHLAPRDSDIRKKRDRNLAMVFQDPLTSLDYVLTVNRQITEIFLTHG